MAGAERHRFSSSKVAGNGGVRSSSGEDAEMVIAHGNPEYVDDPKRLAVAEFSSPYTLPVDMWPQ